MKSRFALLVVPVLVSLAHVAAAAPPAKAPPSTLSASAFSKKAKGLGTPIPGSFDATVAEAHKKGEMQNLAVGWHYTTDSGRSVFLANSKVDKAQDIAANSLGLLQRAGSRVNIGKPNGPALTDDLNFHAVVETPMNLFAPMLGSFVTKLTVHVDANGNPTGTVTRH